MSEHNAALLHDEHEDDGGLQPPAIDTVPRIEDLDPPSLIERAKDRFIMLERVIAGYATLTAALQDRNKPHGTRRKGLPIFSFRATLNGQNVIEVHSDMSRRSFDPAYVQHALVPHINAFATDMCTYASEIQELMAQLVSTFPQHNDAEAAAG